MEKGHKVKVKKYIREKHKQVDKPVINKLLALLTLGMLYITAAGIIILLIYEYFKK